MRAGGRGRHDHDRGDVKDVFDKNGMKFYVWESESKNQDGQAHREGNLDQHREGRLMADNGQPKLEPGAEVPELTVTPDKYVPHRYAGASGDFNPIHIDPEFAKAVGLPRNILHGLYSMAQVARAATQAGGRRPALAEAPVGAVPRDGQPGGGDPGHRHGARGARRPRRGRHGRRAGRQPDRPQRRGRARAPVGPSALQELGSRAAPTIEPHAERATADAAAARGRGARRARAARRVQVAVRARRRPVEPLDDPLRAGGARGARLPRTTRTPPPAGSRPTPATATTPTRCCAKAAARRDRAPVRARAVHACAARSTRRCA